MPPDITTADTTLVIHGRNFNGGDTVAIDGLNAPVTARDYSKADEQITVTLSSPLTAGPHTAVVADAVLSSVVSSPVTFQVTQLVPQIIQITRGGGGSVTTVDTTLVIHGHSFAPGDSVNVTLVTDPTTRTVAVDSGSQLTVTLSQPLPPGLHAVTVTHAAPDGRTSNSYDLVVLSDAPAISAVNGSSRPPAVTTDDMTLIVHGAGFAATDSVVLSGTSASVTVASHDLSDPADERITVTLSEALLAGSHSATVVHAAPDKRKSAPFPFTVVTPALKITHVQVASSLTLYITGSGFLSGATVLVTNITDGTTHTASVGVDNPPATRIAADFTGQALTPGFCIVTVTNPNGDFVLFPFDVPGISSIGYTPGTTAVTIHGVGFNSLATVSILSSKTGGAVAISGPVSVSAAGDQISLNLSGPLLTGLYEFTVTNPDDDATAQSFLTVGGTAPVRGLELTVNNSKPIGGVILTPGGAGFSGSADLMQVNPDPNSLASASPPAANRSVARAALAPAATSDSPIIDHVKVQTARGRGDVPATTFVRIEGSNFDAANADYGLTTVTVDGVAYTGPGVVVHDANTVTLFIKVITDNAMHSLSITDPNGRTSQTVPFGVVDGSFSQGQFVPRPTTSYQVSIRETSLLGAGTSLGVTGQSPLGSAFQKVAIGSVGIVATGGGNVISNDGGTLITNDGGSIIAQGGGNLITKDGTIVATGGGNLITNDGAGIVATGGGNVISNDGGTIVAGGNVLAGAGAGLVARSSFRAFALPGISTPAATSNGFMDVTLFVAKAGQGMRLLVTRYTPGERDLILYKDPSVTVTPSNGTPAPVAAITAGVAVTRGPVTRDFHTHRPFQVLTLTNTGAGALSGPFLIALTGLPAGVTVAGQAAVMAGSPAVAAPGGALAPGASVKVRVDFTDPSNARFSYGTAVYAGL